MMERRHHREAEATPDGLSPLQGLFDDLLHEVEPQGGLSSLELDRQIRRGRLEHPIEGGGGVPPRHVETRGVHRRARDLTVLATVIAAQGDDEDVERGPLQQERFPSRMGRSLQIGPLLRSVIFEQASPLKIPEPRLAGRELSLEQPDVGIRI
jgi:hypothetical protein